MIARIVRLCLASLISAAIGIAPISVMAADPAPGATPAAAPTEAPANKATEKKVQQIKLRKK